MATKRHGNKSSKKPQPLKRAILEVYKDKSKRYRWRKIGANGRCPAEGHEAFRLRRYAAVAGRREFPRLPVVHR